MEDNVTDKSGELNFEPIKVSSLRRSGDMFQFDSTIMPVKLYGICCFSGSPSWKHVYKDSKCPSEASNQKGFQRLDITFIKNIRNGI